MDVGALNGENERLSNPRDSQFYTLNF